MIGESVKTSLILCGAQGAGGRRRGWGRVAVGRMQKGDTSTVEVRFEILGCGIPCQP